MTTPPLNGRELAELVRAAARDRGLTVTEFMRPISSNGTTFLKAMETAANPRQVTRDRIAGLLADPQPAPSSPPVASSPPPDEPPCSRCGWSGMMCLCAAVRVNADSERCPVRASAIPPKPVGRPRTFAEQLAAVAAGAKLVEVRPLRMPPPDRTLGGVGSGLLG